MKLNSSEDIINVLVVDDHYIIREGLTAKLHSLKKITRFNVYTAESGEEALHCIATVSTDVILLDYRLGNGINGPETARRMSHLKPGMKILGISNYCEHHFIAEMINAGASGYVLKSVQPLQLLDAINTILAGKKFFCNEVALLMLSEAEKPVLEKRIADHHLSSREVEVLSMIGRGKSNKEIAQELFISPRTVDTHRQHLLDKLRLHNTAGLMRVAMDWGLDIQNKSE